MTTLRPPYWFRYGIVAAATLILCSCRSTMPNSLPPSAGSPSDQSATPSVAWTQHLPESPMVTAAPPRLAVQPAMYQVGPNLPPPAEAVAQYASGVRPAGCPHVGCSTCSGDGIVGPRDEYLCDGGDSGRPAGVQDNWDVVGLEQEDTVGHYDTVDGRTVITPSNQVCIYSPRFGAVRRVVDLQEYARYDNATGFGQLTSLAKIDENEKATTSRAHVEPSLNRSEDPSSLLLERQQAGELEHDTRLAADIGTLAPYANLQIVHTGVITGEERVKLARASLAAITWAGDQSPQITIDRRNAVAAVSDRQPGTIYHLEEPNKPRLRLIKLASTGSAQPGEEVEFTLRVDNIGNREMGKVTIVDNLTTRLEYVPDSAKASVEAEFSTTPNEGGSEVLRWEIIEPIAAGEGCILTFKCKVR